MKEYRITQGDQHVSILLKAAIGVAEWDGKETGLDLLARADQKVYWAKEPGVHHRALSCA
jgi:GGDEF domain-containing protein